MAALSLALRSWLHGALGAFSGPAQSPRNFKLPSCRSHCRTSGRIGVHRTRCRPNPKAADVKSALDHAGSASRCLLHLPKPESYRAPKRSSWQSDCSGLLALGIAASKSAELRQDKNIYYAKEKTAKIEFSIIYFVPFHVNLSSVLSLVKETVESEGEEEDVDVGDTVAQCPPCAGEQDLSLAGGA